MEPVSAMALSYSSETVTEAERIEMDDHSGLVLAQAKSSRRNRCKWRESLACWLGTRTLLVAILMPLLCAGIGAVVDRVLFGPASLGQTTHFNTRYMAYSALIAAPFSLVRLTVASRVSHSNSRYLTIVDFAIYVLQTVGMAVAFPRAMLAGPDVFNAFSHTRRIFTVNGLYDKIETEEDVYNWLQQLTTNIFNSSKLPNNKGSRLLEAGGRLVQFGSLRLRQQRVKPKPCSDAVAASGFVSTRHCYPKFHDGEEDRSSYSSMNFTFYDPPYTAFGGRSAQMSDIGFYTAAGWYTLAAFWTYFPNDITGADAHAQLSAMQSAGWIDAQTRLIGLDVCVTAPDLEPAIWGAVNMAIDVSPTGQLIPNGFDITFSYMPVTTSTTFLKREPYGFIGLSGAAVDMVRHYTRSSANISDIIGAVPDDGDCFVMVDEIFLVPFYLGMYSAALYAMQVHASCAARQKAKYYKRLFTYTELLWILMLTLSLAFRWTATSKQACGPGRLIQQPFLAATTKEDQVRTGVVLRLELQALAYYWAQARNLLGFAFFLHLFNFLKFLVKFKSLGTLVRTLSTATPDLLSFSISFVVIFLAFVTMHYVLFSVDVEQYKSFLRSTSSLWLGMLGELEITDELWRRHQWALPMMILFTFISVFVLLTLIVAIISNAHEKTTVADEKQLLQEQRIIMNVLDALGKKVRPVAKGHRIAPEADTGEALTTSAAGDEETLLSANVRQRIKVWSNDGGRGNLATGKVNDSLPPPTNPSSRDITIQEKLTSNAPMPGAHCGTDGLLADSHV